MSADSELTLTVELPDGLSESLTVRSSTRVSSLRSLIAAQFGESNATNLLTLSDDTKLDSDRSLSDYPQLLAGASGGGRPRVRAQMQIYVQFFRRTGFMLDVSPGTDVELVKALVYNREGPAVPVHKQKLTCNGRALADSMTLAGAGVKDNDNVLVYVRDMTHSPENGCLLFFVDVKGEEIRELTNMRPSDTVAELKRCLANPHVGDVPYASQRISLAGKFFDDVQHGDHATLRDVGIHSECMINLYERTDGGGDYDQAAYSGGGVGVPSGGDSGLDFTNLLQQNQSSVPQSRPPHEEEDNFDPTDETFTLHFLDKTTAEKKSIKVLQSSTFADAFRKYASRIRANLDDLKFEYDLYGESMVLENSCDFPFETFGVQDDSTFVVENNSPPPMNDLGQMMGDMMGDGPSPFIGSSPYGNGYGNDGPYGGSYDEPANNEPDNADYTSALQRSTGVVDMAFTDNEEEAMTVRLREVLLPGPNDVVAQKGVETTFRISRNETTLPLVFDAFTSDALDSPVDQFHFVYGSRRLTSFEDVDETAGLTGMVDGDLIHVIKNAKGKGGRSPSKVNVFIQMLDFDGKKDDRQMIGTGAKRLLSGLGKAYGDRVDSSVRDLRFFHNGRVVYCDSYTTSTCSTAGIRDGDTIFAVRKDYSTRGVDLTPRSIGVVHKTDVRDWKEKIFEPFVQVVELNEIFITLSDGRQCLTFKCSERVQDILNEVRAKQIRLNSIIQLNDFSIETVDGCREYTIVDAQIVNGLCTNSIISEDLIPPVPADASITEINNQRHNITLLENLNELFRFKLAVVQFRKVYAKNLICEVSLRIAEVRREWRRKMTRVREDFVWAFVASRRRLKLRACAVSIQKMARGLSARRLHLGEVQGRLEEYREFKSVWGEVIEKVREKAPNGPPQISGWAEEREKIDLKHFEDLDDGMVETSGKMADAMSEALKEDPDGEEDTIGLDGEDDDETDLSSPPGSRPSTASSTQPEEIEIDWNQFQITDHVRKYLRTGDKRYRSMFVKKMKQLGKGERSHKLQKPLKGCKSVIYETYLENRTGWRILWTQESTKLIIWFVVQHKSVSRFAKLIDDAKNRSERQQLPQNFVSELIDDEELAAQKADARQGILLDPSGNVPLKLYEVSYDSLDDIQNKADWNPQMHLTNEEKEVVEAKGTILLLGRSGTGKTICISNRMERDRQVLGHKHGFSQLFVARSSRLRNYVRKLMLGDINSTEKTSDKSLVFNLYEELVHNVERALHPGERKFHPKGRIMFAKFKEEFYSANYPKGKVAALTVWKTIRTFIKGSIEAFMAGGVLPKRNLSTLGKNRCKIPEGQETHVYDIFLHYQQWREDNGLWDDCDRIVALIQSIVEAESMCSPAFEEMKKNKIYVDEVQDYTQIEMLLFFKLGKGPGALFLAGDPAQSVVEGTDFRFDEIRSVGYYITESNPSKRRLIPEKPRTVNVNFRSHAGILNCASGFLRLLFDYFPGSAQALERDYGLFKGARPGVFQGVSVEQLLTLIRKIPMVPILVHDDEVKKWKKSLGGYSNVYGIAEAKGLEFKTVIILDFFADLPKSVQKPWRELLLGRERTFEFRNKHPLVETHLKFIYTAVTRSIETLYFAETHSSDAGDAACRWLLQGELQPDGKAIATRNKVDDLRVERAIMTNDELCVVGIENAEMALSSDLGIDQAINFLQRAKDAFEQAQNSDLCLKATVHRNSLLQRSEILRAAQSTGLFETASVEKNTAKVAASLLEENNLEETATLINALSPLLNEYIQSKLDENIVSRIKSF